MENGTYLNAGKWLFASALLGIGALLLISGDFLPLFPVADWMPLRAVLVYLTGIALVAAGALILVKKYALQGACLAAAIFLVFLLFLHLPKLLMNLHDSGEYTFTSESLMFFSGALMLAGNILIKSGGNPKGPLLFKVGKYLFALALFDFSMEHLVSETYVVSIIPAWIPLKTFWAYLVMCAFFAAALSLVINKQAKLAMLMLFLMFFLWIALMHVPQVFDSPGQAFAWMTVFVPIGVCGIALGLAGSIAPQARK